MALAAHDPSGIPFATRTRRRDSPGAPLLGFDPLHGMSRSSRTQPLGHVPLSWGSFPYSASGSRVHGLASCPARLPGLSPRDSASGPTRQLRRRSQVFSTSQRLLPLVAVPPFSGGWRSWGSALQGFVLPRSPASSSLTACLLDVSPAGCAAPILGTGTPSGSRSGNLGCRCRVFFRLQGLRLRGNRSHQRATFNVPSTDLPLLGFHLLMV